MRPSQLDCATESRAVTPRPPCGSPGFTLLQSQSHCPVLLAGPQADTVPWTNGTSTQRSLVLPSCTVALVSCHPPSGAAVSGWSRGISVGHRGPAVSLWGSLPPAVTGPLSAPCAALALPVSTGHRSVVRELHAWPFPHCC